MRDGPVEQLGLPPERVGPVRDAVPAGLPVEGRAASVLTSPLGSGRQRVAVEAHSRLLGTLLLALRERGFRRVAREPRRVGEYSAEPLAAGAHRHRLEWIEPRPRRGRRASAAGRSLSVTLEDLQAALGAAD